MDLRKEQDLDRIVQFLSAVAEAPVTFDEKTESGGRELWRFSWDEATSPTGEELRILAEVTVTGEVRFTVEVGRGAAKRVASSATVQAYALAWGPSVSYARTLVELAKTEAIAGLPGPGPAQPIQP